MIEALIVACVLAATAYLLRPLLLGMVVLIAALAAPVAAAPAAEAPAIGVLLMAVDARPDHRRISEALRIRNAGGPRVVELRFALPAGAEYLTVHRGIGSHDRTAEGFVARTRLPTGLSEIAYSYALPSGTSLVLPRRFPLEVLRLEVVARGAGVRLRADRGQRVPGVVVDGERLPRWEVRALPAGAVVTIVLDDLPASRPRLPLTASGVLALLLAGGLVVRAARPPGVGEETPAV